MVRKRMIVGGIGLLTIGLVGLTGTYAVWQTAAPERTCASCHEIEPSVEGWRSSAHAQDDAATCMDCHADAGFVGEMVAHIGGLQEAYVHLSQKPEAENIEGMVPAERCLECHDDAWADESFAAEHPTKEAPCAVCHRETAHTNEKPIYVPAEKGGE